MGLIHMISVLFRLTTLSSVLIALVQSHSSSGQNLETIYTCCKYQSVLQLGEYCEYTDPEYEFEKEIYNSKWSVPGPLLGKDLIKKYQQEPNNSLGMGQLSTLEFGLHERAPWCGCNRKETIEINLRRHKLNKDWSIIGVKGDFKIKLGSNGKLNLDGKEYEKGEYCLNKLQETPDNIEDKLEVEIVTCSQNCLPSLTLPQIVSADSKIDWLRTANCKDLEISDSSECPYWSSFYNVDEQFFLIRTWLNKTMAIQDRTYSWAYLPKSTYCKVSQDLQPDDEEEETGGRIVKFCIPRIKKHFYKYQEIYAILAGISTLFLLFNLTIYFALKNCLSISGWTEFLYSLALYCYCVLSIVGLLIVPGDTEVRPTCYAFSLLLQFFELANGATLVALSFDIFWTFCNYDSPKYTDDPKVSKLRLTFYIILSISVPVAIVIYGIVKNQRPWIFNYYEPTGTPQYGLLHCTPPDWPLSSYIQFGMQGINLILALMSAHIVLKKDRQQDEHGYLDPDRLDIFSKLFVFIFIFWIVNFIQFFFQEETFTEKWYLVGFHLANYSQGIFAFFILICNRKTLSGIWNREWNLKNLFQHACCTCSRRDECDENIPEEAVPLSPLMSNIKTGSIQRSTIRGNAFY